MAVLNHSLSIDEACRLTTAFIMMTPIATLLPEFQIQSLSLIDSLLPITDAVFFLVEKNERHNSVVSHKGKYDIECQYCRDYKQFDPLNLSKFKDTKVKLATLDSQIKAHFLKQSLYFQDFMVPNNHRYVLDIFLRLEGEIVAVISLLREQALADFSSQEIALLSKLQPFLEFSLGTLYLPARDAKKQRLKSKFGLTQREFDVLDLLSQGMQNKHIAAELGLSLATVKTHLIHIFRKCAVRSRSQLIALA